MIAMTRARPTNDELDVAFSRWAEKALAGNIPKEVVAFSFNLYEAPRSFQMEVIGTSHYDAKNQDWACDEMFVRRDPLLNLPYSAVGSSWQRCLESAVGMVGRYLANRESRGSNRLRLAEAVTVGFVDGDLHRVWRRPRKSPLQRTRSATARRRGPRR
jgi:hypothetical protein